MRIPIPLSIPFVVSNSLVPAAMPTIPSLTPSRTLLSTPRVLPLIPTLLPKAMGRITRSCLAAQHDKREHPFPTQAAPPMPWTSFHPHRARPSRLRQSRRLPVTPCVAHENFLCHPMPRFGQWRRQWCRLDRGHHCHLGRCARSCRGIERFKPATAQNATTWYRARTWGITGSRCDMGKDNEIHVRAHVRKYLL
jgi:hypothetical protein